MSELFMPLGFPCGARMSNRFMLAPMTNCQSEEDGTLTEDEYHWLVKRAEGGFGSVMTCAAHVQAEGKGFPGQLGLHSDDHMPGLTRLASGLAAAGTLALAQLHHAGMRSPLELIEGKPVSPSDDEETGARAMSRDEIEETIEAFVRAAERVEQAGFHGAEIHGAHSYLLCQFLSPQTNRREDEFGGSPRNRERIVDRIIDGIRERCGSEFVLGLRISPERYGIVLDEARAAAQRWMLEGKLDFLDVSLWDYTKEAESEAHRGRSLLSYFAELERGQTRLGVAGKIMGTGDAQACLQAGIDFVLPGRAAILHHDLPRCFMDDESFEPAGLPVTREHLRREGLGEAFIEYLSRWPDFVASGD